MNKTLHYICVAALLALVVALTSCDVHQMPEPAEKIKVHLRLNFETEMALWEHIYNGTNIIEDGVVDTYDNARETGNIRYIIRAYPIDDKGTVADRHSDEFVFTKNVNDGYDFEVTLDLLPGKYSIMVWSDIMRYGSDTPNYNADDFGAIVLSVPHDGNNEYFDAFRGSAETLLVSDIYLRAPDTLDIAMQRPLAKYEIISNDLKKFIDKELEFLAKEAMSRGETVPSRVNTDNYTVVVKYSVYMQSEYSMFADIPIDSAEGVLFESKLNVLSDTEASLGFDYVFVNNQNTGVTLQVGLYDDKNRQLALSNSINVPLRRSHHTVLRGSFLMQNASGGITINPDFEKEDYNIEIK